jgi:hypothetical protein
VEVYIYSFLTTTDYKMEVKNEFHAVADLTQSAVPTAQWNTADLEAAVKILSCPCWESNPESSNVQPVT